MDARDEHDTTGTGEGRARGASSSRKTLWVGAVLAIGAGLAGWLLLRRAPEPEPQPAQVLAPAPGPAAPVARDPSLPSLRESDAFVRDEAKGLSTNRTFLGWLAADDLVGRFTATVASIAEGTSPRRHLSFVKLAKPYTARERKGREYVDPASHSRYDGLADAFASIDAQAAGRLYRRVRPLVDDAWKLLGYPDRPFDDAAAKAFGRLLAVKVPEGDVELVPRGANYAYADPALEALEEPEKHLLRMGPRNAALVQQKLRELAAAMGHDAT